MDCSLRDSSIHGIFQARELEWVAISFSRRTSWPRDRTRVSCIASRCFYHLSHRGSWCIMCFVYMLTKKAKVPISKKNHKAFVSCQDGKLVQNAGSLSPDHLWAYYKSVRERHIHKLLKIWVNSEETNVIMNCMYDWSLVWRWPELIFLIILWKIIHIEKNT